MSTTADDDDDEYGEPVGDVPRVPTRYSYRRGGGKFDGAIKQVGLALIVAGAIGFVGLVFAVNGSISNLRETDIALTTAQQFMQKQLDKVDARQDRLEGRAFRGKLLDPPDADESQSK